MGFRARFTLRCHRCGRIVSSRTWVRTGRCGNCGDPLGDEFLPRR